MIVAVFSNGTSATGAFAAIVTGTDAKLPSSPLARRVCAAVETLSPDTAPKLATVIVQAPPASAVVFPSSGFELPRSIFAVTGSYLPKPDP